ncbi:phosphohydrolase [Vibrio sp. DW001]|uniref:HD-GYP domain-containing protein n=1 Tax=Vibrio sp. DW001 TaxID=2912315 RepID=UPI0023AF0955|nr:HD domain-containing phosphohydrolase [Vibrio sp. DW001]WED25380.1 phosphohydrolase [Vibrio sp. DW001]
MKNTRRTFPIHVHITTVIIMIVVMVSGVQIWLTNKGLTDVIFEANGNVFHRIAAQTRSQMSAHYGAAFTAVGTFSKGSIVEAQTAESRENSLPEIAHLLTEYTHITSYSIYYPDGDVFFVMRVKDSEMRKRMGLREETIFVVTHRRSNFVRIKGFNSSLVFTEHVGASKTELFNKQHPFQNAVQDKNLISEPKLLRGVNEAGIAIYRASNNGAVVAAEVLLAGLRDSLTDTLTNKSSIRVLYDDSKTVFAYSDASRSELSSHASLSNLEKFENPLVPFAIDQYRRDGKLGLFEFDNERWFGEIITLKPLNSDHVHLLMAAKASELFDQGGLIKRQTLFGSLLVFALMLPVIYLASRSISKPIKMATKKAKEIESFNFSTPIDSQSYIKEIQDLNNAQAATQNTISRFISLTHNIAHEENLEALLELVCRDTINAAEANGVFLYLLDTENKCLVPKYVWWEGATEGDISRTLDAKVPVAESGQFIRQIFIEKKHHIFQANELPNLDIDWKDNQTSQVVAIPLKDREGVVIGSFGVLYDDGKAQAQYERFADYLDSLLGFSSVTIETHSMMAAQQALLDSFIKVIAGSLDKKSPYTGNHCQRVPILTELLTRAAQESTLPPFDHFSLNLKEWQELKMASWLHDCGKITTPEHVVDKATKLEAIYNRIHEVRMRFEVIKRDEEITMLTSLVQSYPAGWREQLIEKCDQLNQDFEFVARLNIGTEFVTQSDLDRLNEIASRTWTRTLSKQLGISSVEMKQHTVSDEYPTEEKLLSDRSEHLIDWDGEHIPDDRFTMKPTQYQANRGEIYNLGIQRGTLTEEERFIINDHIVQTIHILESLPFPQHMRNVAKIAGGHHEKMNGEGYPMGLMGSEMLMTAKVMAIADIFEALTSSDRPYKKAKTLSESIKIMSFMAKDEHIDSDLFALFVSSGVYKRFADEYLQPEQIDDVDISAYLT